ncbi:glycosyltransferase [Latilactobacillus curvatus]|uniref:hypothetical protein n=1 Tax=Latilactobacillus curvatus TaxID=28038 RepID=UPI002410DBB3|nr:hypothetical protein [Latilactobacillus curvatus]MDG2978938.1 glycosyltransferase [Latilactobacillus curvatus]
MKGSNINWGVVIVAYNPDTLDFNKKIEKVTKLTKNLIIVNNGDDLVETGLDYTLVNLRENRGIAYAQNFGAKLLSLREVELIFFFDQDSDFNDDYFEIMLKEWKMLSSLDSSIGMLSPSVIDKNFNYSQPILILKNNSIEKVVLNKEDESIKDTLPISSGILVSDAAFKKVKGTKEDYFIDYVDFELDLNFINSGYSIYSTGKAFIRHAIGKKEKRKFLFKSIYPSNHPVFREYYFMRNGILVYKSYGKYFKGVKNLIIMNAIRRFLYTFYEENTMLRISKLCKGIVDARKNV